MIKLAPLNIRMFTNGRPVISPAYSANEKVLRDFLNNHPYNKKTEEIFVKITLIDFTYSTQLKRLINDSGVHQLADFISQINFDSRISKYDPNLVTEIAKKATNCNLFSFATKYCSLHNRLVWGKNYYSIYDNVVATLFSKYTRVENARNSSSKVIKKKEIVCWRANGEYDNFNKAIGSFLDLINVEESIYPERRNIFDGFLWEQRKK